MTTDTIDATLAMPRALYNANIHLLNEIPADHRLADEDEAGWYFTLSDGSKVWITDAAEPGQHDPAIIAQLARELTDTFSQALPAAPAHTIEDHASDPFSTLDTSTAAGREDAALLQTPNLIERWRDAIAKARAATSRIEQREWTEHAISLTEMIVSPSTCSCGVAYSLTTGRCEACDERHEQLTEDRARFGRMALDVDPVVGF